MYLRENDVAVVKQRLIDGAEIIAYQTGYIFYCAGDYGTVFPLFTCRDYVYEAGRKITVVKEDFFDNQPWYVRLILEGEDRCAGTGRYENIIIAFHIAIFQKAGANWWTKGRMYLKN